MSLVRTIPGSATGRLSITSGGWASLSNKIIFVAKHSPVDMQHTPNVANFVRQDLLVGKPRQQKLGINLQEIKITVKFHHFIRPFKQIKEDLKEAAYNGEILTWLWGNGEVVGDFIIKKFEEKPKKTDAAGLIFATEVELSLEEYAGPGVEEQTGIDARRDAFANKQKSALNANLPAQKITAVSSLSQNVQIVKVENAKLQTNLTALQKGKKSLAAFKRDVLPVLSKIKQSVERINSAVNIARNIKNANSISSAASLVNVAANSMSSGLGGSPTLVQIGIYAEDVSNAAGGLDQVSAASQVVKSWFPSLGL